MADTITTWIFKILQTACPRGISPEQCRIEPNLKLGGSMATWSLRIVKIVQEQKYIIL